LRLDNFSINHFGLIGHATGAAGEWDAVAAVEQPSVSELGAE
jgi:hypothetical protein